MKPIWLFIVGGVLLLISAAMWWLEDQKTNITETPPPAPTPIVETVTVPVEPTVPESELGQEAVNTTATNHARRVTHVPDTRPPPPTTNVRDITADNANHLLQTHLEQALNGDMASAYFVSRTRMACERFASTPEDLERRIQRTNRNAEKDVRRNRDFQTRGGANAPWSVSDDTEDNRAHLENWYEACQRVRSVFTLDLRQQLESQALQGDVMAGYLYATWPLDSLDVGDAFEQQFRWEGLARDFSQANLDKGEVAGLMAFAQSYMNGWFTRRNGDLALAFAIAATNCSFEAFSLQNFMENRIDHLSNSDDPADLQRLQFALLEAERLGQLCIQ